MKYLLIALVLMGAGCTTYVDPENNSKVKIIYKQKKSNEMDIYSFEDGDVICYGVEGFRSSALSCLKK